MKNPSLYTYYSLHPKLALNVSKYLEFTTQVELGVYNSKLPAYVNRKAQEYLCTMQDFYFIFDHNLTDKDRYAFLVLFRSLWLECIESADPMRQQILEYLNLFISDFLFMVHGRDIEGIKQSYVNLQKYDGNFQDW